MRFTDRDLAAIRWLADMKAVYESDLPVLLSRLTGQPEVGHEGIRTLLARWRRAGIADARKLMTARPRVIRLLPQGALLAGAEGFRETSEFTAWHQADVSQIRLYLERKPFPDLGSLTEWESERQFRQHRVELFGRNVQELHVPDGVATWENGTASAIEVERTTKSLLRLTRIMTKLIDSYDQVIYAVGDQAVARNVRSGWAQAREIFLKRGSTRGGASLTVIAMWEVSARGRLDE